MRFVGFRPSLFALCLVAGVAGAFTPSSEGPRVAHAQFAGASGTTGATNLAKEDFYLELRELNDDMKWSPVTTNNVPFLLNRANCECETPVALFIQLTAAGRTKLSTSRAVGDISVRLGNQACVSANATERATENCPELGLISPISALNNSGPQLIETNVKRLFSGLKGGGDVCRRYGTIGAYLFVDADQSRGVPDLAGEAAPKFDLAMKGNAPPAPANVRATPGNEALIVGWDALENATDLAGYVVLCARDGDKHIYDERSRTTIKSVADICPETAGASAPPFRSVNPVYACSGLVTQGTDPSVRIKGLQNGIPYVVGVAAVDLSGNASPIENVITSAPIPTQDFYDAYRSAGGESEGGYCSFARRRTGATEVLAAAALAAGVLLRRTARKRDSKREKARS